jgi:hypothetical protein
MGLPTADQQHERLEARFQQIIDSFLTAQETIDGAEPEMVIVFETAGKEVVELAKVAREIEGLEWLAELDSDEFEATHGFQDTKHPDDLLPCRLYAVMSNHSALESLIRLWNNGIKTLRSELRRTSVRLRASSPTSLMCAPGPSRTGSETPESWRRGKKTWDTRPV